MRSGSIAAREFFSDGPFGLGVLSMSGAGVGAETWDPKISLPVAGRVLSVGAAVVGSPLITATWTAHSGGSPGLSEMCTQWQGRSYGVGSEQ